MAFAVLNTETAVVGRKQNRVELLPALDLPSHGAGVPGSYTVRCQVLGRCRGSKSLGEEGPERRHCCSLRKRRDQPEREKRWLAGQPSAQGACMLDRSESSRSSCVR